MDPTTFRLLSGAAGGSTPPVEITFTASNYYPSYNTSTTLYWTVTNSVAVSISNIGAVSATGSAAQTGSGSYTYYLTATGLDGLSYESSFEIVWGPNPCTRIEIIMGWNGC